MTPHRRAFLAVIAVAGIGVSAAAAPAASSRDLERLVRRYYAAVAAEDIDRLAPLLCFGSQEQATRYLGVYRAVFQATDTRIEELRIERVEADQAAGAAAVHVRTQSVVSNHDRSDRFRKEAAHVVLCLRREGRWRVAKVLRAPDYQMRMQLAQFNQQVGRLEAGPQPDAAPKPPPSDPPPADTLEAPVAEEMRRIEAMLGRGDARGAAGRICGALATLWKRRQRSRWSLFLAWVRRCRARFPALNVAGRTRLDWLEGDLSEFVREEADWAKTVAALRQARDAANRVRLLEDYLRRHVGGFYRPYAQAALEKLRRDQRAEEAPSP